MRLHTLIDNIKRKIQNNTERNSVKNMTRKRRVLQKQMRINRDPEANFDNFNISTQKGNKFAGL